MSQYPSELMACYNQLGLIWSGREEHEKARGFLDLAQNVYVEFKQQRKSSARVRAASVIRPSLGQRFVVGCSWQDLPDSQSLGSEVVSGGGAGAAGSTATVPFVASLSEEDSWLSLERLYTHTLFYLGQVLGNLGAIWLPSLRRGTLRLEKFGSWVSSLVLCLRQACSIGSLFGVDPQSSVGGQGVRTQSMAHQLSLLSLFLFLSHFPSLPSRACGGCNVCCASAVEGKACLPRPTRTPHLHSRAHRGEGVSVGAWLSYGLWQDWCANAIQLSSFYTSRDAKYLPQVRALACWRSGGCHGGLPQRTAIVCMWPIVAFRVVAHELPTPPPHPTPPHPAAGPPLPVSRRPHLSAGPVQVGAPDRGSLAHGASQQRRGSAPPASRGGPVRARSALAATPPCCTASRRIGLACVVRRAWGSFYATWLRM